MIEVLKQLFILFSFVFVGYILRKKHVVNEHAAPTLSKLLVYVFAPAVSLKSLSINLNLRNVHEKYLYLVVAAILLMIVFFAAKWLSGRFSSEPYEKSVYAYSFTVSNYGYMGYALVQALFGDDMLLNMVLFSVPTTIYIYTEGLRILTEQKKVSFRNLVNPAMFAIVAGAFFGLAGVRLPEMAGGILTGAGNCMAPVSMIMTGFVLAEYGLKPLFLNARIYVASVFRLLLIPLAVLAVLLLFRVARSVILIAVLFYCLPAGLNGVVFPKMINKDCKTGLAIAVLTNLFCIFTIPVFVHFLSRNVS